MVTDGAVGARRRQHVVPFLGGSVLCVALVAWLVPQQSQV